MWAQPHTPFDTSLGTTKNSVRTKEGKIKAGIFQQSGGVTMLTEYIGNIGAVEAGQIIVVVGKTVDAASRYFALIAQTLAQIVVFFFFHCC